MTFCAALGSSHRAESSTFALSSSRRFSARSQSRKRRSSAVAALIWSIWACASARMVRLSSNGGYCAALLERVLGWHASGGLRDGRSGNHRLRGGRRVPGLALLLLLLLLLKLLLLPRGK